MDSLYIAAMGDKRISINIDRSDVLAILAFLVSLGAMFISIQQTEILKDQQEIMAAQMEGTVWPYLKTDIKMAVQNDQQVVSLKIANKGVGPAKMKAFNLSMKGVDITNVVELFGLFEGQELSDVRFHMPEVEVIRPNEELEVFNIRISEPLSIEDQIGLFSKIEMCYCSIYDQCYGEICEG